MSTANKCIVCSNVIDADEDSPEMLGDGVYEMCHRDCVHEDNYENVKTIYNYIRETFPRNDLIDVSNRNKCIVCSNVIDMESGSLEIMRDGVYEMCHRDCVHEDDYENVKSIYNYIRETFPRKDLIDVSIDCNRNTLVDMHSK
jgi:hypothetical protein